MADITISESKLAELIDAAVAKHAETIRSEYTVTFSRENDTKDGSDPMSYLTCNVWAINKEAAAEEAKQYWHDSGYSTDGFTLEPVQSL